MPPEDQSRESKKCALGQEVHYPSRDGVSCDPFKQARSAGYQEQSQHQRRSDNGDNLLDSAFAALDARDMLGDPSAAIRTHTAAFDGEISLTFGAFDFGLQRHAT